MFKSTVFRRKRGLLKNLMVLCLVFIFAFHPILLPIQIAWAENNNLEQEQDSDLNNQVEAETETQLDKPLWKTCDFNKEFADIIEEKTDCQKDEYDSCDKIEKCLSIVIENKNEAAIENETETSANSGNNQVEEQGNEKNLPFPQDTLSPEDQSLNQQEDETGASNQSQNCPTQEESTDQEQEILNSDDQEQLQKDKEKNEDEPKESADKSPDTKIETGDAASQTNVVNEANQNVVSQNSKLTVTNITGQSDQDINLLDQFNDLTCGNLGKGNCTEENGGNLEVTNNNVVDVVTVAQSEANTGDNLIAVGQPQKDPQEEICSNQSENETSAQIETGDAIAITNIFNFLNTNIIGENWLMSVINVFGDWAGDLIVPGEGLLSLTPQSGFGNVQIKNNNQAEISNQVQTGANTGDNSVEGSNETKISTGQAIAQTNITNIINTNIVKNNWFFLMINKMGSWTGNVLNWNQQIQDYETVFSYDFGLFKDEDFETGKSNRSLSVTNNNQANVTNMITASANTGGNDIISDNQQSSASIKTGNASAFSNIVNLVNTNIVGSNWLMGIVNVFGSWKGNVVFGYPDLELSLTDHEDAVLSSDQITYEITCKNLGETATEDTILTIQLDDALQYLSDNSNASAQIRTNEVDWNLPGIEPGQAISFQVSAKITDQNNPPESITTEALAETSTKETELENNLASDQTSVYPPKNDTENTENDNDSTRHRHSNKDLNFDLDVRRKKHENFQAQPGQIVQMEIKVNNDADGPLLGVKLNEEILDGNGNLVGNFTWDLDDMFEDYSYLVQYEIQINPNAPAGNLFFRSTATAHKPNDEKVKSNLAVDSIIVLGITGSNFSYLTSDTPLNTILAPAANAAEIPRVLGDASEHPFNLPLWIWVAALVVYYLVVDWSLFSFGKLNPFVKTIKDTQLGAIRDLLIPMLSTLDVVALWLSFGSSQQAWFLAGIIIIFFTAYGNWLSKQELSLRLIQKTARLFNSFF